MMKDISWRLIIIAVVIGLSDLVVLSAGIRRSSSVST